MRSLIDMARTAALHRSEPIAQPVQRAPNIGSFRRCTSTPEMAEDDLLPALEARHPHPKRPRRTRSKKPELTDTEKVCARSRIPSL